MNTPTVLSISQLNGSVRELLEFNYGRVWLRGEISNMSAPSSGHLYFTLKDEHAQVRAAMFRGARTAAKLQTPPSNGQQVLVRAKVSLYAPRGDYQLIVEHLEDAGRGALQQAFEMLKSRLAAEGLFSPERKRALPAHPRGVAVLTSPSGAAVRDIVQVLKRRAPGLAVSILPVPVQGAEAPAAIVTALTQLQEWLTSPPDNLPPIDVLIVARGGGSLEDLWAFNDEAVVRALADMPIPVVSGVGHEIDFTIADFVVDVRAPTPSAAAELVSQDQMQLGSDIAQLARRNQAAMSRVLQLQRQRLQALRVRLRSPERLLQDQRQRLDTLELRLQRQLRFMLSQQRQQLQRIDARLHAQHPARRLDAYRAAIAQWQQRLQNATQRHLQQRRQWLQHLSQRAHSVSPLAVLGRGYALVTNEQGQLLRSVNATAVDSVITARLHDGEVSARVLAVKESP